MSDKMNKIRLMACSLYAVVHVRSVLTGCKSGAVYSGRTWPDNNGVHINAHGGGILHQGDTGFTGLSIDGSGTADNHWSCSRTILPKTCITGKMKALSVVKDDLLVAEGCILERPKVIYNKKNNNYVMWVPSGAQRCRLFRCQCQRYK